MSSLCMLYSYHKSVSPPTSIMLDGMFRPVALPQNKWFEGWTFGGDWGALKADWVGHVTYSYTNKMPAYDFHDVVSKHSDADIIGLLPCWSPSGQDMYQFVEAHHPGFMRIWARLIALLGYGDYRDYPVPEPFYCNYWIMKRPCFLNYCDVAKRAMQLMDRDKELREWVYGDSRYFGTVQGLPMETLMEISGRPYYTFHPFLIERLVCFVAVAEKVNLVILPRGHEHRYVKKSY